MRVPVLQPTSQDCELAAHSCRSLSLASQNYEAVSSPPTISLPRDCLRYCIAATQVTGRTATCRPAPSHPVIPSHPYRSSAAPTRSPRRQALPALHRPALPVIPKPTARQHHWPTYRTGESGNGLRVLTVLARDHPQQTTHHGTGQVKGPPVHPRLPPSGCVAETAKWGAHAFRQESGQVSGGNPVAPQAGSRGR